MNSDGKVKGLDSGWEPRATQKPTETKVQGVAGNSDTRRDHPAFAMIGAYRWTGGGNILYASPIKHHSGVTIRCVESYEEGDEYSWTQFGHKTIFEVHLSEAQWASFVTAMNVGSGVPCTLSYRQTGDLLRVPTIDDTHPQERRAAMIKEKVEKDMAKLREFAEKFKALLDAPGQPGKTALRDLYNKYVLHAIDYAPGNYEFAGKLVSEHWEHVSQAAHAEFESYVLQTALRFPGLAQAAPELPQLTPPKESDSE